MGSLKDNKKIEITAKKQKTARNLDRHETSENFV